LLADSIDDAVPIAQEALKAFGPQFDSAFSSGLRAKLGLVGEEPGDSGLIRELFSLMANLGADFTLTFRKLSDAADSTERGGILGASDPVTAVWEARWRRRLEVGAGVDLGERRSLMRLVNPLFIPRNHVVEEAISAAQDREDFVPFENLLRVLSAPYEEQPGFEAYALPPEPSQIVRQTFCGT
jgi:serine/tyrosine/threonine adenylyltransferase